MAFDNTELTIVNFEKWFIRALRVRVDFNFSAINVFSISVYF
jgi:hypothetical protein